MLVSREGNRCHLLAESLNGQDDCSLGGWPHYKDWSESQEVAEQGIFIVTRGADILKTSIEDTAERKFDQAGRGKRV